MHVAERVRNVSTPFMDGLHARSEALRREGADVISLGQGVPGFPPVAAAVQAARQALEEPWTHLYGADAGLPPLREALSLWLARHHGLEVDPATEMLITAGANQAFMLAALTLLDPGDKVLLPSPFYFNHEMAVRIAGGVPVEVPLREDHGFQLTLSDLEPYLETQPRALVVVSPNNPTGAVYEPEELRHIAAAVTSRGITIVSDETYQDFTYQDAKHLSLGSLPEASSHVITIGSFSKTFSLTGWRVGYLLAQPAFVEQALKVQDSMLVCATVISQKAALGALSTPAAQLTERLRTLDERRRLLMDRLSGLRPLGWHPTRGAYYAFVRVAGCSDSSALAEDILERVHVAAVPGSVFGPNGEGYLRLSYGSVARKDLEEACARLARYFDSR